VINDNFFEYLENIYFCVGNEIKLVIWEFLVQMLNGDFKNEIVSKFQKINILEMATQHLEDDIGDSWDMFVFFRSFFDFIVNKEKDNSEKVNSFFKNLIFKLKVVNKGNKQRLLEIENFKKNILEPFH
jgi:hypothetical protein